MTNNAALPEGFDPIEYLNLNPDVQQAGVDPTRHWIKFGHREGRKWRPDIKGYLSINEVSDLVGNLNDSGAVETRFATIYDQYVAPIRKARTAMSYLNESAFGRDGSNFVASAAAQSDYTDDRDSGVKNICVHMLSVWSEEGAQELFELSRALDELEFFMSFHVDIPHDPRPSEFNYALF